MYTRNVLDIAEKLLDAPRKDRIAALLQEGKPDEAINDLLSVVDYSIEHASMTSLEGMTIYNYLGPSTERQGQFPQSCAQQCFAF